MAATNHAQTTKMDTRAYITEALMQLLSKEKLPAITVSRLCKRAGVSRMAFYRNYDSPDQVLYAHYLPKISAVFDIVRRSATKTAKFAGQLDFFNTFGDALLLAVEREYEWVIRRIFMEEMEKFYAPSQDAYHVAFMSSGVYAVWRKWLVEGRKKPLAEIMTLLKRFDID